MRLAEFFYEKTEGEGKPLEQDEQFRVKKKNWFIPPLGRDKHLDLYIELVKNYAVANLKRSDKLNISKDEKDAYSEFLHNKDLIITPANKGSGIVVVNRNDYIESLQKEVSCIDSYQETVSDQTEDIQKRVKRVVNQMHKEGIISSELRQYLIPRYVQAGKLKGNLKLHKPNAPFRTIVDSKDTPTEKLVEGAEKELNDFVEPSPSFIRDTLDFIRKLKEIKEPLSDNSLLFSFDVVKLYPSVPAWKHFQ